MNKDINIFEEQVIKSLLQSLLTEKDRFKQEKLEQRIGRTKDERTAELVAELLYSEDAYIRNIAIELFIALEEKALPVLKEKLGDKDRNIRKFALDALKYINKKESCEIALSALDDLDENVVVAALEVISEQLYKEATDKLLKLLQKTSSVWIMNGLFRTFAKLETKNISKIIEEKILTVNATSIEKNILVNIYVQTLGSIGSYEDIEVMISKYAKDLMIDKQNLFFALTCLIVKNDISKLPMEIVEELEKIFIEHWDYKDSNQILFSIATFIKLQLDFFVKDFKEIYGFCKGEEFFIEKLCELIKNFDKLPASFMNEILTSDDLELVEMGLNFINTKKIAGFNNIVEKLCNSQDIDISKLAICILTEIDSYKNTSLIEKLTDNNEEAGLVSIENISTTEIQDIDNLLLRLEHQNPKVRKAAAQKLISLYENVKIESLEQIIRNNPGEEGIEALEVLLTMNSGIAWNYINFRIDSMNENVRVGLVDIVKWSTDDAFYDFMNTMVNDPSPVVRKKTIKALNSRINDRSLALLKKLYEAESNSINMMDIISNFYKFNNDSVMKIIKEASLSSDILIRLAAVKAMSLMNSSDAIRELQRMLWDQVEEVVEAVKEALSKKEVDK